MMVKQMICAIGLALTRRTALMSQEVPMTPLRPGQVAFLALYKELVEPNTTVSAGSCTLAAERISAHLKGVGFSAAFALNEAGGKRTDGHGKLVYE
jgi:hypothetical protein